MASNYTPSLGLENPATGDQTNVWGITEDTGRTLVDQAIAGLLSKDVSGNSDVTLSSTQGVSNEARNAIYLFTGALTGNINIFVPAVSKVFLVVNATTGAFTLNVTTAAGSGQLVNQGTTSLLYCDGTDVKLGLSGFLPPISITQGGTAATTAPNARANLGLGSVAVLDAGTGDAAVPTGTLLKGTERGYSAAQYPVTVTIIYQANVTLDLSMQQDATMTLAGDLVLSAPTNMLPGLTGNLELVQDGAGGHAITYATGWTFPSGQRPALSTTAGAIDVLSWRCRGATMEANLNKAFA